MNEYLFFSKTRQLIYLFSNKEVLRLTNLKCGLRSVWERHL